MGRRGWAVGVGRDETEHFGWLGCFVIPKKEINLGLLCVVTSALGSCAFSANDYMGFILTCWS
jgi:hypothetical protein